MAASATELQLVISAQNESAAALEELQTGLTDAQDAADKAGASMSAAMEQVSAGASAAAGPLTEAAGAADEAAAAVQSVGAAAEEAQAGTGATAEAVSNLGAEVQTLTDQMQQLGTAATEATAGLEDVATASEAAAAEELSFSESIAATRDGIELTQTAMTAFMGIAAAGMLGEWADGAEKTAIALNQLQGMTGQTAAQTEQLSLVASAAGINLDSLTSMVGRMDMRMGRAMSGTSGLAKALSELGVNAQAFTAADPQQQAVMLSNALAQSTLPAKSLTSMLGAMGVNAQQFIAAAPASRLQLLSTGLQTVQNSGQAVGRMLQDAGINASAFMRLPFDQQLSAVAKAFNATTNSAQATALVMTVFGRSGSQMIPLLQNFSELDAYAKQLKMPVLDTHEITIAAEKTKMLTTAMEMLLDSVLVKILPLVDNLGRAFYDLATNLTHPITAIRDFVHDLGPATAAVTALVMAYEGMKIVTAVTGTVRAFDEAMRASAITQKAWTAATGLLNDTLVMGTRLWIANTAQWVTNTATTVANTAARIASTAATAAWSAVTTAATAVAGAFGVALDVATGPIGLIALGIGVAIAATVEIVKHWTEVEKVAGDVWRAVGGWVKDALSIAPFGAIQSATAALSDDWRAFGSAATAVWDDIGKAIQTVVGGIESAISAVESAISAVSGAVHAVAGGIGGATGAVGGLAGHIPKLAEGGVVHQATLALIGESGPEAVVPLNRYPIAPGAVGPLGAAGGGAPTIIINVSGNVTRSEQELANIVASEFQRRMKMTGQFA